MVEKKIKVTNSLQSHSVACFKLIQYNEVDRLIDHYNSELSKKI